MYPTTSRNGTSGACGLASADFNGDGIVDLAVGDLNGVGIYLGNKENRTTFKIGSYLGKKDEFPIVTSRNGTSGACDLASADLDGDSFPDLIVGDLNGVRIYLNDGKADFSLSEIPLKLLRDVKK